MPKRITVAMGDGIGPEIMKATLEIIEKAGAQFTPEFVEIGEAVYNKGVLTGIEDKTWDSLFKNKIFFKAPITTPQGGGFKSLNVTVRKTLGLFANVRRCSSYHPFISTKHKTFDVVIVRENEEDLYSGIEHRQTEQVYQCLKLFSQQGCQRISEFAFEYARQHNRKKVTCFTKDNIMKMTDGLFRQSFEDTAKLYPDIEAEHWIIDIGAAKLADTPQNFDVIVTANLYGDILSDITAQMSGSVGMGGSSNLGNDYAMFEAIHGSAPRRAGQDLANPSGLLMAGVDLLVHIGQLEAAEKVKNAWLKTIEDGIHTYDIYQKDTSKKKVGTKEFTKAIVERLGDAPRALPKESYKGHNLIKTFKAKKSQPLQKKLIGADLFFDYTATDLSSFIEKVKNIKTSFALTSIKCRGLEVWPGPVPLLQMSDHWGLRYVSEDKVTTQDLFKLIVELEKEGLSLIKTEGLFLFDGIPAFSGKGLINK